MPRCWPPSGNRTGRSWCARRCGRTAGLAGVVAADGTRPAWADRAFDRVLVDAPCSGLGALRRRPESRWRRRPEDLAELVPLQRALLTRPSTRSRPGGVVLYATCSPVVAETVDVVGRRSPGATTSRSRTPERCSGGRGRHVRRLPEAVQLWPHRHGTDAMFLGSSAKVLNRDEPAGRPGRLVECRTCSDERGTGDHGGLHRVRRRGLAAAVPHRLRPHRRRPGRRGAAPEHAGQGLRVLAKGGPGRLP